MVGPSMSPFVSFGQRESCTCALLLFVPCRMSEEQEQRVCIKFCVKLGRNGAKTFEMFRTAFREQCLCRARTFEWHKRFKEGRDSVDDNPQSGRLTTSKTDDCVARVRELIRANQRLTICKLFVEVGVSYGTCQAILTRDLNIGQCTSTHSTFHPGIFLQVMAFLSISNHPSSLTWLRVTFGCSPS
jgi:hypothetical protein